MVGESTAKILKENNINYIGDLIKKKYKKTMNISYEHFNNLKKMAKGLSNEKLVYKKSKSKSISSGNSFLDPTNNYDEIITMIKKLCKNIYIQIKEQKILPRTISVNIRNVNFSLNSISRTYSEICNLEELTNYAIILYEEKFLDKNIRTITINVSKFIEK